MILIISNDSDQSTNLVIKWLLRFGKKIIRIGQKNFISSLDLQIKNGVVDLSFLIDGERILYSEITGFWYRKHMLNLLPNIILNLSKNDSFNNLVYSDYLITEELQILSDCIVHLLEKKTFVGNIKAQNGNKLINFINASEIGLKIPETYISTNLKNLTAQSEHKMLKVIQDLYSETSTSELKGNYFDLISTDLFKNKEDEIFPSCLQEYIDKKIEIRSFYLYSEIFSMAIFSQNDTKTMIDFRNYNEEKPNRMLPYKLPLEIEQKIDLLMKKSNLNTGSLDLILTKNNEYVFLEINPAGQYGMVHNSCNYGLDKHIANIFLNEK